MEMTQGVRLTFDRYEQLPTYRDGFDFLFRFRTVDTKYVGAPEEPKKTRHHKLIVGITGRVDGAWQLFNGELVKTLFELGKRHVISKIKDGTLGDKEELQLTSVNAPNEPPFDPKLIPEPNGDVTIIPTEKANLSDNPEMLHLGGEIVDALDNINTVFHYFRGAVLFVPRDFRATLELVRPANSKEEYIVRVSSLAQLVDQLNTTALREITGVTDSQVRSVSLLEKYLTSLGADPQSPVKTLRQLLRIRQGYPIHADTAEGVQEAYEYFGIDYPVTDFKDARIKLLRTFLKALLEILGVLKKETKPSSGG